jgi:hypothetical protein
VVRLDWLSDAAPATPTDTAPPTISATSGTPLVAPSTSIAMKWSATDRGGPSNGLTYDVRYKVAAAGSSTYSAWRYPAGWQDLTAQSVSASLPVGAEACFEVRATDRAGNVGAFGGRRCNAVSYDDRAMKASRGVSHVKSAKAMNGTLSRFTKRHAKLSRSNVAGKTIAFIIRRGPRQGAADVYVGTHLVGTIKFKASRRRFAVVQLPTHGHRGTVKIRSTSARPSLVDGMALLR